jgi:hypothetical protein
MLILRMRCNRHPNYKAKRAPKDCQTCQAMWEETHPRATSKTWPAKVDNVVYKSFADDSILITRLVRK